MFDLAKIVAETVGVPAVERAKKAMTPSALRVTVFDEGVERVLDVERRGVGPLLTEHGAFHEIAFRVSDVARTRDGADVVSGAPL